jgi:L,D-transpeptidase-like protein
MRWTSTRVRSVVAATVGLAAIGALPGLAAAEPGLHVSTFRGPTSVVAGERAAVVGRVAPPAATRVVVQRLLPSGVWTPLATLQAGPDGRFAGALPLKESVTLRASVPTAAGGLFAGPQRTIGLRRALDLTVVPRPFRAIAGQPLDVLVRVRPATAGEMLRLEGSAGGPFRLLRRLRIGADGAARATLTVPSGGRWRFRVSASAEHGLNEGGDATSAPLPIYGLNPHGVPANASHYIVQVIHETQIYYYEDGRLIRVFPVVFGKPSTPSPVGSFRVYAKGPGPRAAFGPLVLWYHGGFGIHGTDEEYLLAREWRYYSHGCTRNYNANILWLWPHVPVGTPVVNLA